MFGVNIFLDLYQNIDQIIRDEGTISLTIQLMIYDQDYVVHQQLQLDFYHCLRNPLKELHKLCGFYQDTLGEIHNKIKKILFDFGT